MVLQVHLKDMISRISGSGNIEVGHDRNVILPAHDIGLIDKDHQRDKADADRGDT